MENSSSTSSSDRIPAGGLIAFALVLAFEIFVAQIPDYATEPAPYFMSGLDIKREIVERDGDFDLLVLGGCFTYDGVVPKVLEEELGVRAFNLAVNRAHLHVSSYVLFERYLKASSEGPLLVALEVSPDAITRKNIKYGNLFSEHILPFLGPGWDLFLLSDLPEKIALLRYLITPPSVKRQYFLRRSDWIAALMNLDRARVEKEMGLWWNDQGYLNKDRDILSLQRRRPITVSPSMRKYETNELNLTYIEKILTLAGERSVPVVLFTPAINSERKRVWSRHQIPLKHREKLFEIEERHANVAGIVDMMDYILPDSWMADNYHLNYKGAMEFSKALGERLRPCLPERR